MSKRTQHTAIALAIAMTLVGGGAVQAKMQLPTGAVTITGTRYVNGVPTKVKCTASAGHILDASYIGQRVLALVYDPTCPIYWDSDDNDELVFSGPEAYVVTNGTQTSTIAATGRQVAGGPAGSSGAKGSMSGTFKSCSPTCRSVKGSVVYQRDAPYGDVMFIGTYKAHF